MSRARPVLFGEVLFDRFPGGEAVLGGAPFNVAWHLQAFGLDPLFLSRVGDDALGRDVLAAMSSWGMDTAGVQVDPEHPTGAVAITLSGGEPSYEILADQAYDHIAGAELPGLPQGVLLCHGTLALRAPPSRAALAQLVRDASPRRLVDVNLRAPWWRRAEVLSVLEGAAVIKLNEGELAELTAAGEPLGEPGGERQARALLQASGGERIVVTRGARGAQLIDRGREPRAGAPGRGGRAGPADRVVDTVGAGDAFTAVLILGECRGWDPETTLQRGLDFAEAIVAMRGATTGDRDFYTPFLRRWTPS